VPPPITTNASVGTAVALPPPELSSTPFQYSFSELSVTRIDEMAGVAAECITTPRVVSNRLAVTVEVRRVDTLIFEAVNELVITLNTPIVDPWILSSWAVEARNSDVPSVLVIIVFAPMELA